MTQEQFYTSGTWVCPANVSSITIECYAGGGGGAKAAGNGGGGGAYSKLNIYSVVPGTSYSYSVGAGGPDGFSGGDTDFNTVCYAVGGDYGDLGGTGGAAAGGTGDIKYSGGNGAFATAVDGGGGGGGAGSSGAGGNGSGVTGGTGGGGYAGAGGTGDTYPFLDGTAGNTYGGGGGGAELDNGTGYTGADGMIQISYEFNPRRSWEGGSAHNSGGGIAF